MAPNTATNLRVRVCLLEAVLSGMLPDALVSLVLLVTMATTIIVGDACSIFAHTVHQTPNIASRDTC